MDIKELIKNNRVHFDSYRQGVFYYRITHPISGTIYHFPVPTEDMGTATLLASDKAITYMRWIRKAIADKTLVKVK